MDTEDLEHVYGAKTPDQSRQAYNAWAGQYDADNLKGGFRLPFLGAGLLARYLGDVDGPILDAGCGTGLVGESLKLMGYDPIIGADLSPDMMAVAETRGVYGALHEADFGQGLPFDDNSFAGFVCVGSFGPGHAPPVTLTHLARVVRSGGYGVFNLLDATYQEQGFPPVIEALTQNGSWTVEYITDPFLPFLLSEPDLWSRAYVVRML